METATQILSDFEVELISIITSKGETVKRMRAIEERTFEKCGEKSPEQIKLHNRFQQQPKQIQTSIHLEIDSDKLAEEVLTKIVELIKKKKYPVKEVLWVNFIGTTRWCFTFSY